MQILEKFRNFDENFQKEIWSFFEIFVSRPSLQAEGTRLLSFFMPKLSLNDRKEF